jgi:hypothetical protein
MNPDERIAALEGEVKALKGKPRDGWDKFSTLSAALIPLSIAAVGGYYTYSSEQSRSEMTKAQATSAEATRQSEARQALLRVEAEAKQAQLRSEVDLKIKQAELVSKFFDALTGQDERRRELAVKSLLVAAPDYGPVLVRAVSETSSTPKAAVSFAVSALDQRRDFLIRQLFSEEPQLRKDAYNQLVSSWSADESLVTRLVGYGTENISNSNGVFNAVVLLSHLQKDVILKQREAILSFAKLAEKNGAKTQERVSILRDRLGK